jgi:hypothetical protein
MPSPVNRQVSLYLLSKNEGIHLFPRGLLEERTLSLSPVMGQSRPSFDMLDLRSPRHILATSFDPSLADDSHSLCERLTSMARVHLVGSGDERLVSGGTPFWYGISSAVCRDLRFTFHLQAEIVIFGLLRTRS